MEAVMSDAASKTSLAREIRRLVALSHINDEVVDTDALAKQIQAKFPYTDVDELADKITMEVISRRGAMFLSQRKKAVA